MRGWAWIVSCLCLAGCSEPAANTALSTPAPLFGEGRLEPGFREGVWVSSDLDCALPDGAPLDQWPDCARALLIQNGRIAEIGPQATAIGSRAYLLVRGPPHILQTDQRAEGEAAGEVTYDVVIPVARDDRGRIVAADVRRLGCSAPLPPSPEANNGSSSNAAAMSVNGAGNEVATSPMLPGLNTTPSGCTADRTYVIFSVARVYADERRPEAAFRWVRDGTL